MARLDGAHAHQRTVELLGKGRLDTINTTRGSREAQLKVFATVQGKLKRLDLHSTRILVVTMRGTEVDRATSGEIVQAIEHNLQDADTR